MYAALYNGCIIKWDVGSRQPVMAYETFESTDRQDYIESIELLEDPHIARVGCPLDSSVRYVDLATGRELCRQIFLEDEILTVTPEGLFDGWVGGW